MAKVKTKEIIFEGTMTYNRKEETDYRGRALTAPVNKVSFKADDIATVRKEVIDAGVDPTNPFTPKWIKDESCEYVNLKSKFDIPAKVEGLANATQKDVNIGAKCKVKIIVKDNGNIYPVAFSVIENGAEYNPFEGI